MPIYKIDWHQADIQWTGCPESVPGSVLSLTGWVAVPTVIVHPSVASVYQ